MLYRFHTEYANVKCKRKIRTRTVDNVTLYEDKQPLQR